jgi:4-oxalocrotonate tautomerase
LCGVNDMPLVRITMKKGKSPEYLDAMEKSIYEALVESYGMPKHDHFQIFELKEPGELRFDRTFRAVTPRTDDFVILQIRADARRMEEKDALFKFLKDKLGASPGIKPQDIFVTLDVNTVLDDWSFGEGISASKGI